MKLKSLTTKHLVGLPDRTFSFADESGEPRPLVAITGGARSGKTALLQAIAFAKEAVGAYGATPFPERFLPKHPGTRDASEGRTPLLGATWVLSAAERSEAGDCAEEIEVAWDLSTGEMPEVAPRVRALFRRFSREPSHAKAELFPARRGLDTHREAPLLPAFPDEHEGRSRLGSAMNKYNGVFRALNDLALADALEAVSTARERGVLFKRDLPDSLTAYKQGVAKMCPDLRLIAVEPVSRVRPRIWLETRGRARVEIGDLSDSEISGVLFALAFTWLGLDRSLVLIDTPELHIHPSEQARFVRALSELGTNNQLVVATGSPEVLSIVPPGARIDLDAAEATVEAAA